MTNTFQKFHLFIYTYISPKLRNRELKERKYMKTKAGYVSLPRPSCKLLIILFLLFNTAANWNKQRSFQDRWSDVNILCSSCLAIQRGWMDVHFLHAVEWALGVVAHRRLEARERWLWIWLTWMLGQQKCFKVTVQCVLLLLLLLCKVHTALPS